MLTEQLERRDGGQLQIDLCFPCYAIWFDRWESVQLAPGAIVGLFKEIHSRRAEARHPLGGELVCPRCVKNLLLTRDLSKTGPFSYYRCPQDHGRLTPFFEFLREKHFVRVLTPAELTRVRAEIKEVMCSGCGAPINLELESKCSFCAAPIAVLDADAVEKGMRVWAEAQRRRVDPDVLAEAMRILGTTNLQAGKESPDALAITAVLDRMKPGNDILQASIGLLGGLFKSLTGNDPR
jgi:hypothetical protein